MSRENSMLKTRWTEERLSPYARFNQNIKPQIQISLLELLYLRVEVSKHTRDPSPPLLSEDLFVFGTGSSRRREKIHPELGTLESLLWNSIRGTKASALKRRNSNNFLPPAFLFDDLPRTSFLHATYVCIIRLWYVRVRTYVHFWHKYYFNFEIARKTKGIYGFSIGNSFFFQLIRLINMKKFHFCFLVYNIGGKFLLPRHLFR